MDTHVTVMVYISGSNIRFLLNVTRKDLIPVSLLSLFQRARDASMR
jgi:hypothetical protein